VAEEKIRAALAVALRSLGVEPPEIRLERPRDPEHGDLATNVALTLAGALRRPPREVAGEIARLLDTDAAGVTAVEVAGPGFLNFRLAAGAFISLLPEILRADQAFGRSDTGASRGVMVEFVSANPTGLLHLGHGRQAALGDAVASLLDWTGWRVHREFYYNDAGKQIDRLTDSVRARYAQALGRDAPVPEDGYHGDEVVTVAADLVAEAGDRLLDDTSPEADDRIRSFAVAALRREQDRDLTAFRVHFDCYYLESSLYEEGRVDATVAALRETGLVYDLDGAVWLRTTEFGDQKDRVMIKADGSPTYFLPDVAYHLTKWERGFHHVINVQGADHHGTVARVRAGLRALGLPEGYPEYVLHQMVTVERGGEEVKFSKRAGGYTTLRDLCEAVGVDVTRYFFQMRKPDGHLVFDLDMALDQSDKNPVYKSQYAHARMCSIFKKAGVEPGSLEVGEIPLHRLTAPVELALVKQLGEFPGLLERAASLRAPHLVCEFMEQTAGAVNSWYHAGNPTRNPELAVLVDDPELRLARLALADGVRIVLRNGLTVLGLTAPDRMDRDDPRDPD